MLKKLKKSLGPIFIKPINWREESALRDAGRLAKCLGEAIKHQQQEQWTTVRSARTKKEVETHQFVKEHYFHDIANALGCSHLLIESRTCDSKKS